jgi:multidrug efflux pump subunit AcrB
MTISEPFIGRPIATALLLAALLVGGIIGYNLFPVAALPSVDFPTISVNASLPGAGPEIMASSVRATARAPICRFAGGRSDHLDQCARHHQHHPGV